MSRHHDLSNKAYGYMVNTIGNKVMLNSYNLLDNSTKKYDINTCSSPEFRTITHISFPLIDP